MLPRELYAGARALLDKSPVRAAQMHEQALMLDLLQHDPMRRFTLASIDFNSDFIREGGHIVRLWISGQRTKNGIAIDTPIPPNWKGISKRISQPTARTFAAHHPAGCFRRRGAVIGRPIA